MASIPVGVTLIEANNSYLYLPLFNGFNLQSSLILGPEEVEPGAVAPGQYIYVHRRLFLDTTYLISIQRLVQT